MKNIKELKRINLLYDIYSGLISGNQREIFEDYYHNDYSICEIAKQRKVSRQFISSMINSALDELNKFDSELGLIEKSAKRAAAFKEIAAELEKMSGAHSKKLKVKMEKLLKAEYNV